MALFKAGDAVERIEDRQQTAATVVDVIASNGDAETTYKIDYEESGSGYWPESALRAPN